MGGNLGTEGSVGYLFTKVGQIAFSTNVDVDKLMDVAIEAGAEDVVHDEDEITVHTTPEMFGVVVDAMKAEGFVTELAEVTMSASVNVSLDLENAEQFMGHVEIQYFK